MNRAIALLFLATLPAAAQLQVYIVNGSSTRVATAVVAMGTASTGEALDVQFRIINEGTSLATLQTLTIAGTGFTLIRAPTPPAGLAAGLSLDFFARFQSAQPVADARATLRINGALFTLVASATGVPTVYLMEDDGSRTLRTSGQSSVFPPVEKGARSTRRFVVVNPFTAALAVSTLAVSGDSFQLVTAAGAPFTLSVAQSRTIDIAFQPPTSGLKTGVLTVGDRRFPLEGVGNDSQLPRPTIILSAEAQQSGKQARIGVRFDAPSRGDGAGILRVEFTPAVAGPADPVIAFPTGTRTSIPFLVKQGESQASFGSQTETLLQTGTTAGTLRLSADMGGFHTEATAVIRPAPVVADTVALVRGVGGMEVSVKGFDNTRSATRVSFTFWNDNGELIQPGTLTADASFAFQRYFAATETGGLFLLKVNFSATGSTQQVKEAQLEFFNNAGSSRTERLKF